MLSAIDCTCLELTGSGSVATAASIAVCMTLIISGENDALEKSFIRSKPPPRRAQITAGSDLCIAAEAQVALVLTSDGGGATCGESRDGIADRRRTRTLDGPLCDTDRPA